MSDADVPPEALSLIEVIAEAIRNELGEEIDAYAGYSTPDRADPMNRAFRAAVGALLRRIMSADVAPAGISQALRHVAERRLAAEGWSDDQARSLIEQEAGSPDDWLAFLILSSTAQIAPLLKPDDDPA